MHRYVLRTETHVTGTAPFIDVEFITMGRAQTSVISTDSVKNYLTEIGRVPLLTHEQEISYGKAVQQMMQLKESQVELGKSLGRPPQLSEWAAHVNMPANDLNRVIQRGQRAKSKMVQANLRLVVSIAKKYQKHRLELMDLVQEGAIGLQRGVEKFDPTKGYRFSTYAYWWIRQAITRAIAEKSRTIRLPIHVNEKLTKLRRHQRQLAQSLGRQATVQELAAVLTMSPEQVRELVAQDRQPLSLDLRIGENQDTDLSELLEDSGQSPQDYVAQTALKEDLKDLIQQLTPQQQEVITLRYGLNDGHHLTLAKIGAMMGISRERVRQIEREALKRLRQKRLTIRAYLAAG